jgi:cytochrome P450
MAETIQSAPGIRSKFIFDVALDMRRKGILPYFEFIWRQHGDIIRLQIGSDTRFIAIHPDHVRHISVTNRNNYTKDASYDVVRKLLLGDGLVTSTGDLWRRQRKLMSPFFTPAGIQAYGPLIVDDTRRFITRWDGLAGGNSAVEMLDEMMLITALIILRTMFSIKSAEKILELKDAVETMIQYVGTLQLNPLRAPLWVPTKENVAYRRAVEQVHVYINEVVTHRRTMPESDWPEDLLSRLMLAQDEETGERMSDQLLKDEVITIFFAGHETTARTMTFAWYALSQNQAIADRLHAEVDRVIGDRPPTMDDLRQMPFALQVIKETLRLYPPAPMYARDAIADDEIDGVFIPAGSPVLLIPYCTHRHPDFWDDPETFNPDRWTPENEKAQHPYAYHPFAAGQRVCIGNNFSLFESHIMLTMLARRFAPRLQKDHQPQIDMAGTLISKNGLPMYIEHRN